MNLRRAEITIASGLYLGFIPLAPATFGSLWALPIWFFLREQKFSYVLVTAAIVIIGTIISADLIKTDGKDPRFIVIDEIAGLLVALLPVIKFDWRLIVVAFILFRIFDIIKPFPIRRLENIKNGIGVMADDILAGVYAAVMTLVIDKFVF